MAAEASTDSVGQLQIVAENKRLRKIAPNFTGKACTLSFDMLQDWLFILSTENTARIKKSSGFDRMFLTSEGVNFLFTCCEKLDLPQEVKYTATALFDEFMLMHVDQLYCYSKSSMSTKNPTAKTWPKIEDKIGNQMPLRIVSCIQIASKIFDQYEGLRIKHIVPFLRESFGRCYDPDALLNSEMRILKTLNYKISISSPLEYVETLLKLLYLTDNTLKVTVYWEWSLALLDLIFLHREAIYTRLMRSAVNAPMECFTRSRVSYVEADYMLLACGVICVTACCIDGFNHAQTLSSLLQQITRVPSDDMSDLCIATVQYVVSTIRSMATNAPGEPLVKNRVLKSG